MGMTRREMLLAAGVGLLGTGTLNRVLAADKGATKKVLFFTKSCTFQHSVIAREGDKLAHAERILTELGKEHGFEVVASKDGRLFDPDKIGEWDAFAFQTTGVLTEPGSDKTPPMSKDGKKALLDAIRDGKGFIGMHCATDTFHSGPDGIDPYIDMIGGEFIIHGAQQVAKIDVIDPEFPGAKAFGTSFEINDEWYAQKNLADDLHVILAHDTKGMTGLMYDRPNFPETWARAYGKGRVFYTSMGHREDVWANPLYQGLLLGALNWATGKVEVNIEPNISKATPGYKTLGK
ncbi:ThuA domain-containing protein [Singulisphaera sp. PoT]|uniref:ThuA domain-containing protein n=1 Tax=Singulisphaera sp. PoT TaxID=3411797 RepID=UPI003BF53BB5